MLSPSLTDAELAAQYVATGCQRAATTLVCRYAPLLQRVLKRAGVVAHEVDDLVQQAFAAVFQRLSQWNAAMGAFSTWLCKIASNQAISHFRAQQAQKRRGRQVFSLAELACAAPDGALEYELPDPAPLPDAGLLRTEQIAAIRRGIHRLSKMLQVYVRLRYYEELSYKQIADRLQVPLGTVKGNLYRARRKLAEGLFSLATE